ncbi:MAG: hypothetical protein ACXV5Q_17440, partial [Frankiaceae bacterium]
MDATTLPPARPPADGSPEPQLGGAEEALLDEQAYEVLAEAAAVVEPMEQLVDMEALDRSRRLIPPRLLSLEQALEFCREDECAEVTP